MPTPAEEMHFCETIAKSGYFDADYYLNQYPDVVASGMDPLLHYVRFGDSELRSPARFFDPKKEQFNYRNDKNLFYQYVTEYSFGKSKYKKTINIVFCTNNNYIPFLYIALISLKNNINNDYKYAINILYTSLTENNIEKIRSLNGDNLVINVVNVCSYIPDFIYTGNTAKHVSTDAFYRIVIPEIFEKFDKIIYLDCDILLRNDIRKLYEFDIDDSMLAGCPNYLLDNQYHNKIKSYHDQMVIDNYINSGVLLYNIEKCRKNKFAEKCFDLILSGKKFLTTDQDIINMVCKGKITRLSTRWNMLWHYQFLHYRTFSLPQLIEYAKHYANPDIIHFSSNHKPWNYDDGYYTPIFWEYAKKSPFYEDIVANSTQEIRAKYAQEAK